MYPQQLIPIPVRLSLRDLAFISRTVNGRSIINVEGSNLKGARQPSSVSASPFLQNPSSDAGVTLASDDNKRKASCSLDIFSENIAAGICAFHRRMQGRYSGQMPSYHAGTSGDNELVRISAADVQHG